MKNLYTENAITTSTITTEAKKMYPHYNLANALYYYRKVQLSIVRHKNDLSEQQKQIALEKLALASLLLDPVLQFDVRGN